MQKKFPMTGIILAGGQNSRVNGNNKAFFKVGSQSIFDRIYTVMRTYFDDLIVVTRAPHDFLNWDIMIVPDFYDAHCSLNGIYTGLLYANNPQAFVVACDTPFVSQNLLVYMCMTYRNTCDIYYPKTAKGDEPFFAIYSKGCLNTFKNCLQAGKYKISKCFKGLKTCIIDEPTLRSKDTCLLSFFNVNTSKDLEKANIILKENNNEIYSNC
ncbi:MAG: molybdopterin-guanine dinucleotide biosynthesis protein A [Candidatus Magnetoglobus multicellularis str. Araruama]|uniref:Probable molybdenum cofactor guanylyltransferase n=1 Tax=Candidatus Magnetoglobus multicellularis str. Araruama TaxID=890399 RepID=A0A1V1P6G3_9BACT|nr:MAG: molybdopterin-guanine dinucleotide biosynthesis protein A [Candidatus Magnetoglobus multicellularis str. Araruama]